MAEVLAKPWEVRQDLLENMSRHLTGAIENVTSLESHVMSERDEKEITPLAEMALVAEDKAMYDTQKSVTDNSEIPVETEIEEVGKSRQKEHSMYHFLWWYVGCFCFICIDGK